MFRTIALAAIVPVMLSGCIDSGSGEKPGMIVKLAQQGILCKTWEAELVRGGFNAGTGVSGQSFDFTITDPELLKKVQYAMENQKEVKIHYRSEAVTFCSSDSNHFLTNIEIIENSNQTSKTGIVQLVRDDNTSQGFNEKVVTLLDTQRKLIEELVGEVSKQRQELDAMKGQKPQ